MIGRVGVCDLDLGRATAAADRYEAKTVTLRQRGAAVARLVEEFGIRETLKMARPDDVSTTGYGFRRSSTRWRSRTTSAAG
jgi:hypothetical protein